MKKHALHECMDTLAAGMKPAVKKKAKEADTASANVAATRAGVKPIKARESVRLVSRMREAVATDAVAPNRVRMVMIEEGLGNFVDAMFYTKECIESGPAVFEGAKIFADHPSLEEEEILPERSIDDMAGHWEDVSVETGDEGQALLVGTAVFVPGESVAPIVERVKHGLAYKKKYPDKDFIAPSINADGFIDKTATQTFLETRGASLAKPVREKLEKALAEGVEILKVASAFREAESCDLVTKPGAGGRVLTMLEQERKKKMRFQKHVLREADKEKKGGADAGHDDAEKDKTLIKSMLDKHLGEEEHSEETMKAAHEAYQAMKASGMAEAEASEAVGHSMKCAKVMAAGKAKAAEADAEKAKEAEAAKVKEADAEKAKEAEAAKVKEAAKKLPAGDRLEKLEADNLKLSGELAALRESEKKRNLVSYLDTKLAETKLARDVTKKFRESVKEFRDEKDVDAKLSLFLEAYRFGGGAGGEASGDADGFVVGQEKTVETSGGTGTGFSDCAAE